MNNPPRYTSLGFFAVPAAPGRFQRQGGFGLPVLDFVLSTTRSLLMPLEMTHYVNASLSLVEEMAFPLETTHYINASLSLAEEMTFPLEI